MTEALIGINVVITAFVDNYQPGIVGCEFTDMDGRLRYFTIKFYDVSDDDLGPESDYPRPGVLGCEVISRTNDEAGREIAEIETDMPSQDGEDRFRVFADQLTTQVTQAFISRRERKIIPLIPVTLVTGVKKT